MIDIQRTEHLKKTKYGQIGVVPVVFTAGGDVGREAMTVLNTIIHRKAPNNGWERGQARKLLLGELSVVLIKYGCKMRNLHARTALLT